MGGEPPKPADMATDRVAWRHDPLCALATDMTGASGLSFSAKVLIVNTLYLHVVHQQMEPTSMRKYVFAIAALALGGSAQAADAARDDACGKIDRCIIKHEPNDGGAGKGHAVGFLGEASQHCDLSHNPNAMFNIAAWVLCSLRTTDRVSEQQSNAWIMEGGQTFDDSMAKDGLKWACEIADAEAARWGAANVIGKIATDQKTKPAAPTPAPAATDDSVSIETSNGSTFAMVKLGVQVIRMMVDTGASVMSVPRTVANALVENGDAVRGGGYRLKQANGAIIRENGIIIHKVTVGSHVVRDVGAAVAPDNAYALLPLTVLNRIGKFTIDYANNKLSFN
jgi:gag-polyprotein putative aspartyl protease